MKTRIAAALAALLFALAMPAMPVTRAAAAPTAIQIPAAGTRATLPLHILARVGQPGEVVTATLRWQNGTYLSQAIRTLRGPDGRGLLVGSLDWTHEVGPLPEPSTQAATLELRLRNGRVLARQTLTIVNPHDPAVRTILLYWVLGDRVYPRGQPRSILRTTRIGTAALEELLWGPGPRNFAGFTTALPVPPQVLSYTGRQAGWGPRVTLRKLTIVDGVATADFSRELKAYGGGSTRVQLIRQQITKTLLQFPTVRQVRIAIEGQTDGVLEP